MDFPMASDGADHFPYGIQEAFVLANATMSAADKKNDFVLHYLANEAAFQTSSRSLFRTESLRTTRRRRP